MPFSKTEFPDLLVYEPAVVGDERGYFFESYNEKTFLQASLPFRFVQDNQARSAFGVLRGLHFQRNPFAQTKLIRVLEGVILDVVVDLRVASPCFGKVFSLELSAANKKQLLVPKGFAHGYSVLSETAEVFYKCDEFYNREYEGGIAYNDPELRIDWKLAPGNMIISGKDLSLPSLAGCIHNFEYNGQEKNG